MFCTTWAKEERAPTATASRNRVRATGSYCGLTVVHGMTGHNSGKTPLNAWWNGIGCDVKLDSFSQYKRVDNGDVTYSRVPCVAPWCVAACCTGLSPARTHWNRWTNPNRTQGPPKTDSPPSCKRTLPWPGQLDHAHTQRRSRTTSPGSLPKKETKGRWC